MNRWTVAAAVVLAATVVLLLASPSWLLMSCNDAPDAGGATRDCGWLSPFAFGFLGFFSAAVMWLVGVARNP
jgi:hypothetical protein